MRLMSKNHAILINRENALLRLGITQFFNCFNTFFLSLFILNYKVLLFKIKMLYGHHWVFRDGT